MFVGEDVKFFRIRIGNVKRVKCRLKYEDWITVEASYEYFRRHMEVQWRKVRNPKLRRKKSKAMLENMFMERYLVKSNLVNPKNLVPRDPNQKVTRKEVETYLAVREVEGGKYNKQVVGGLMLNEQNA
jgi:hypothetical protein